MKDRIKFYLPAAAAFVTMMAMSLTSSTMSFFLEPVCDSLQISRGSFSTVFSLMAVSGAATNSFLGQYAGKKGVRNILLTAGIWVCAGMVLFSMAKQVWLLYAAGFFIGAFSTNCAALCANVMVQQAYSARKASGILGVVMAGSGVGGMLFNILIPWFISGYGWQVGARAMGICWLVLHLIAALLLGKETVAQPGKTTSAAGLGMTQAEALKSPKLYLLMGVIVIITACCGIQQQLPSLLHGFDINAETVSVMISVMTAFLAVGKILQGMVYGWLGLKKGGTIMLSAFLLGFLAMLSKPLAYPGLILLAIGMGIYTTMMPLVVRRVFGSREYAAIWGLIATVGSVGTFVANPVWGTIYDLTGSYAAGQIASAVLLAAAIYALLLSLRDTEPAQ